MARQIIDYIRHPETLDTGALMQLRGMVDKYPYYQAARIMYLRALYEMHDPAFDGELRRAAVLLPSRRTLYELFESHNAIPDNPIRASHTQKLPANDEKATAKDSTEEFLADFLTAMPEQPAQRNGSPVDARQDYMEWLMSTGDIDQAPDSPAMGQEKIDIFLDRNEGHIALDDNLDVTPLPQAEESTEVVGEVPESQLTEALAHIYIKQKQYGKALRIIQRIAERRGEKQRHYMDQLRFLSKLIINQNTDTNLTIEK